MNCPKNPAEEIVSRICRKSFLALWSYPNPRGKGDKELCDVLVICDPHVIIVGVKDLTVARSDNIQTGWERWQRKAIDASVNQIYGAERWLQSGTRVIRKDGSSGVVLPIPEQRQVHRLAVALGSKGHVPMYMGDFGKGFVHVLDELSLERIIGELDTIIDLVKYLDDKESMYASGTNIVFEGGEEDLLALYLNQGRRFPKGKDVIIVGDGIWEEFTNRPEYQAKKLADKDSYMWDRIVDQFAKDILEGNTGFSADLDNHEWTIRVMAREDRFSRRILGKSFKEFLDLTKKNKVRSRMVKSPSGVLYIFLATPHGTPRQFRAAELSNRCFIARGLHPECNTVVGIATEQYEAGKGFSLDAVYLFLPNWTEAHEKCMRQMQKELGYFASSVVTQSCEDEYPQL